MRAIRFTCVALAAAVLALSAGVAGAAVPGSISIEGALLTSGGGPVSDGDYKVTFLLYKDAAGGKAVWSETVAKLAIKGGAFQHSLGSVSKLSPAVVDSGKVAWLAVQVDVEPELKRNPLNAVPFAHRAAIAEAADFTYAGSKTKGGPASDLQCTGCVGVSELKIDGDLDLGGHTLKAKTVAAGTFMGSFVGDGSKLTGLKLPNGKCKAGHVVVGVAADGSLICASAADSLPIDGLDNVSGGLLTNEFAHKYKSVAPVKIKDNNPIGVSSTITVADIGAAQKLIVTVDVSNSDFGAVEVWLFAPNGAKYVLFSKDKSAKSVKTSYPVPTKPVSGDLGSWVGKNPKGKWILKAIDTSFKDNTTDGAINNWDIAIEVLSTKKTDSTGVLTTSGGFKMQVAASPPVACTAAEFGRMYINSQDKKVYVCRDQWDAILFADCGNGIKEFPEECDDGNQNGNKPGACRTDCKKPFCGDKIVDPGETCDDGNKVDGDSCKNNCTVPCNGTIYKGICLMHSALSGESDKVPGGCTPYQPSVKWGKADFEAICKIFSPKFGWNVNCTGVDMDADGGLCTNFKAIAAWEGNTSPDVWLRNPTFSWKPTNGSQNCKIFSLAQTAAVYACK